MIHIILETLGTGVIFGASSGISPGPLSVLSINETLRRGYKDGLKVACSPLFTDLPIILFAVFLFNQMSGRGEVFLTCIAEVGALFLFFLAYKSLKFKHAPESEFHASTEEKSGALLRGLITNFLNPYPYVFWMTVGAPYIIRLVPHGGLFIFVFLAAFYLAMLLVKFLVVFATARGKQFMSTRAYELCIKTTGLLMLAFGIMFAIQGYTFWRSA